MILIIHQCVLLTQSLASDWVDGYQEDPESAMVELIQFFVLCCGCKARISLDMFREDTSNVIRTLTENFAEVGVVCVCAVVK